MMTMLPAVNDNAGEEEDLTVFPDKNDVELVSEEASAVIGAAILVATAFKLRDEDALVHTLRGLATAVANLEHADAD